MTVPGSLVPRLATSAIAFSKDVDDAAAAALAEELHAAGNRARALVAAFDIRESTTFMLHLEDFAAFAAQLAEYMLFLRHIVTNSGGWFDKFTGDGALVFWLMPELTIKALRPPMDVLFNAQKNFLMAALPMFRMHGGCIPERYGLAVGIDYGACMLSDLTPAKPFTLDGQTIAPQPVTNSVTVLGRPVVGAVRMVTAAGPHCILCNEQVGQFLFSERNTLKDAAQITKVAVYNKDLRGRQEAYKLGHKAIDECVAKQFPAEFSAVDGGAA